MQLHNLPTHVTKGKRRLGLGHGSGRGKTAGRGTKGQKARGNIPLRFEGGALVLVKRMPFLRGNERNKSFRPGPMVINLSDLATLPAKTVIDTAALIQHKIVSKGATTHGVKILGNGDVTAAYTVKIPTSKSAATKIEKAGGNIAA